MSFNRSGYIGRAPGDSAITIAQQYYQPTGVQTDFTFSSGYDPGLVDVYRNGVKLINVLDYAATDGSTISLDTPVGVGSTLQVVAYKAFNLATVKATELDTTVTGTNLTLGGDLSVSQTTTTVDINVSGAATVTGTLVAGSFSGDGSALTGVASTDNIITGTAATFTNTGVNAGVPNLNVVGLATVGIITAYGALEGTTGTFSGALSGSTGTFSGAVNVDDTTDSTSATSGSLIVDGGVGIAKNVYIGAGLSVAGTLTYEDVTNVDSVGLITAKSGVNITGGQLQVGVAYSVGAAGVVTAQNVTISAGTIDLKNSGSVSNIKFYCESSNAHYTALQSDAHSAYAGNVTLTLPASTDTLIGKATTDTLTNKTLTSPTITGTGAIAGTFTGNVTGTASNASGATGDFSIADKIVHTGDTDTAIRFPDSNIVSVETAGAEDMRIASGKVGIGTNNFGSGAKLRLGTNLLSLTQDMSDGGFTVMPTTGDTIATGQVMPLITAAGEGGNPHILRAGIAVVSTSGRSGMDMLFLTRYSADGTALDCTDDEKMRITTDGRVCIGATSRGRQAGGVTGSLQVEGTSYHTSSLNLISNAGASSGNNAHLTLAKSRGTVDGDNTIVADGDSLGIIQWAGADGTDLNSSAANIRAIVSGTPGSNDMPGALLFETTSDGAATCTERLRIGPAGQIGIGGANYGTSGQILKSQGSGSAPTWGDAASAGFSTFVVLTSGSSASWSVPSGVTSVKVICTGGGGGGGASEDGGEAGGGGGAGGTVIHYFDTSGGGNATYTVGGGGGGASGVGQQASSGTDSTFAYDGTTLTGEGGKGGYGQQGSYQNGGGPGGTGSGGQLNLTGGAGNAGMVNVQGAEKVAGGAGGLAFLGGSTAPKGNTTGQRTVVANTGAGGVGAIDGTGGSGSSGIIVIEY